MKQVEIEENVFHRALHKEKLNYWISAVFGLVNVFFFFIPFIYTDSNKYGPSFVSGFNMLSYMQDRDATNLFYGTTFALIGYILGVVIFFIGLLGLFMKKDALKRGVYLNFILPGLKFASELYAIIAISLCSGMNIHPEFGFYMTVVVSGCVTVVQIVLQVLAYQRTKIKAS